MTKKVNKKYEFFKPSKFCEFYPARAKVLDDGVLSKYVSYVLVDRSKVARGSTYLLITSSSYKKACKRFAPMTDDFEMRVKYEIAAPLREQAVLVDKCNATIAALNEELAEYQENRQVFENKQLLASQELSAVLLLKRELQQLIEHLKIGDSEALSLIRGVFERIEKFVLNKFVRPVSKLPRYAK